MTEFEWKWKWKLELKVESPSEADFPRAILGGLFHFQPFMVRNFPASTVELHRYGSAVGVVGVAHGGLCAFLKRVKEAK